MKGRILLCVLLYGCLGAGVSLAEPAEWHRRLEDAYARAALGAELKYIDGLLANRAADYQVLSPVGQRMDLSVERDRFANLFESANRVAFKTTIVKLEEHGQDVFCLSDQVLKIERLDKSTGIAFTEVVSSKAIDQWRLIDGKPRVLASRVLSQTFSKGPQLEDDRLWPVKPVPMVKPKKRGRP